MKIKPSIKFLLITLTVLLFLLTCMIAYGTKLFTKYWQNNPPTTTYNTATDHSKNNGLISHWEFENLNNLAVSDRSGNENPGKIESSITSLYFSKILNKLFNINYMWESPKIVKGIIGNAIEINGKQWVSGGNVKGYNTNTFTISTWVWIENDEGFVPTIMAKSSWPYDGWWLCTKPSTRYIDMGIAWGDSVKHIESGYELPLKEWHQIAVTMNNEAHEIQFFIDGLLFGKPHENIHKWLINWNHDLFIGDYDGSGRWPWIGKIDDTYYFDKILSDKEITEVYNFNTH
ncbi:MAG TPA: LamG domain-containing protein [Prolixibacteraceae bacterium]|nr:LamG domain-containing protein [Prolixibacteraceae bacterium]